MIVIDGRQTDMKLDSFANLEEILVKVLTEDYLENRIVTDVLVNEETFSEIYPHQAEDVQTDEIRSLEIRTVPVGEMAVNISRELYKVIQVMTSGAKQVATLFRQADDTEALELLQDLIDVTRDFMGMISTLRAEFSLRGGVDFQTNVDQISDLLTEMTEVLENEDWILLADLLEYEFLPVCENWKQVIQSLREDIRKAVKG
ncbi:MULTISPECIES: hypothetical protein [Desulfovibrionaceae]|jgi:hypothetical protein|uniref:Uncharacterized protein n=2 Tax=Nitratidesulfovibrio vulgaris TaxID=881 RepID=Q72F08_NITV2|nr:MULTISPECIES: hypothetical protein [Desulfovibrionaceae]GEB80055.1 hypothetical protein DDE01_14700 [Desulfovibrio desulfuricans]AAS94893.1 hypothetical protein DVU_0410 [Nitratidesulfovibrio vulgaris str. Hildenborough]ABM29540.1 conserved hypothetical protein [Nitratidesulfovibrio vulgaris DP4]ADP85543.1 hypothetical protein Deval_0372 [Nitratidesulfovibrio vulgaris RCH1]WCB47119.1 hypothetical protein PH214_03300 [Nitratidesulfovibrio vulgaris]